MSGVTDEGFEVETVDTIKTAVEDELKVKFGASFNVRSTSVAGIIIGVIAQKLADLWDAAEAIYGSQYPETAFGQSLDQLGTLTGAQRLPAERSTSPVGITGTNGTLIPLGSRIKNTDTGTFWQTTEDVTIPVAGATTGLVESEDYGEIIGLAGTLNEIDTVIAGWTAVNNEEDAETGRDVETDAQFRLRRAQLLTSQGKGTIDAIRADVLAVAGVLEATVYENVNDTVDADGLPGHSFEVVARLDDSVVEQEIFDAIWASKPAGISAYGSVTGSAEDSAGTSHLLAYTETADVNIYVALTATTTGGDGFDDDAEGIAAIKLAIVNFAEDEYGSGDDVVKQRVQAQPFDVLGVVDVPTLKIDRYASPTATSNIAIDRRSIAAFDSSRIDVALI